LFFESELLPKTLVNIINFSFPAVCFYVAQLSTEKAFVVRAKSFNMMGRVASPASFSALFDPFSMYILIIYAFIISLNHIGDIF